MTDRDSKQREPGSRGRIGVGIILAGVLIAIFGGTFILQSRGLVGPSSSFMVNNPVWTPYGAIITAVGAALVVLGLRWPSR